MVLCKCFIVVACLGGALAAYSGWNETPDTQYHIQTDEGPERYFRYQTKSGQYRKEKRLQDGTVIGSYGWVDANGYLRLRDYIADNQGYRILKSKTVFVGPERPIEAAVKSAQNVPPQAGILVNSDAGSRRQPPASVGYSSTSPPFNSRYLPNPPANSLSPPYRHSPQYPSSIPTSTPSNYVSPNSIDVTDNPVFNFRPTVEPIAASDLADTPSNYTNTNTFSTTDYPTTPSYDSTAYPTPSLIYEPPITDTPVVHITSNSLGDYKDRYQNPNTRRRYQENLNHIPESFGNKDYQGYQPSEDQTRRIDFLNPNSYRHADSYHVRRNDANRPQVPVGDGYTRQYPLYDGVSVTNDGFKYYLPRQYHEEQNSGSDTRVGSFGYVDPFGIRRVIYYNTAPGTGFQHRKNNRYVGLDGTPYDPRPI